MKLLALSRENYQKIVHQPINTRGYLYARNTEIAIPESGIEIVEAVNVELLGRASDIFPNTAIDDIVILEKLSRLRYEEDKRAIPFYFGISDMNFLRMSQLSKHSNGYFNDWLQINDRGPEYYRLGKIGGMDWWEKQGFRIY